MKPRDFFDVIAPGGVGLGVITLSDAQAISAIIVAFVTCACTLAVTWKKLGKDETK